MYVWGPKNRQRQFHHQTGNRCEHHKFSEMNIINGCPVSQWVWHAKEPFAAIAMNVEHRSTFEALYR